MRRATFLAVLTASLLSLSSSIHAGKIDFDNAKDSTGILEHARRKGRMRRARPLSPIKDVGIQPAGLDSLLELAAPLAQSELPRVTPKGTLPLPSGTGCDRFPPSADDPGGGTPSLCKRSDLGSFAGESSGDQRLVPITGPYEPLPRDNPDYKETIPLRERLVGDVGKFGAVPPPIRDTLLTRWNKLDATRSDLISQARPLDADDEALSRFAGRLNTWLANIRQRKQILDADTATYNRVCLGRPLPDDEFRQCESYRIRFNNCVERHNASSEARNRLVGVWQDGKRCLESRGNTFRAAVANWVNQTIRPWINDAKRALGGGCDGVKSMRMTPANPPDLRVGGDTLILQGFPGYDGEIPCPIRTWEWRKENRLGDIGTLTPEERMATLVTGPQEAVGALVLRVTDSMNNTAQGSVVVTVRAAVETCDLNKLASHPNVKNVCNYICPDGSTPSRPLDDYGIPDPANPRELICRPFILLPGR